MIDTSHLNQRARYFSAMAVLDEALSGRLGRMALVSSFGADSAVLLHMTAQLAPHTPILFLDTQMLFAETLAYQKELAIRLGLEDVRQLQPDAINTDARDPYGALHTHAPDTCCDLRKTEPLSRALDGFDGWVTGRKRFQTKHRATLEHFEEAGGKIKINPLAHWAPEDLRAYMVRHALPPHPLVAKGFRSIGCAPCTRPVAEGEDPRAGRWAGQSKSECGIHIAATDNTKTSPKGTTP